MKEHFKNPGLDSHGAGTKASTDTPGVIAPPPIIYLGSILLGLVMHRLWPLEMVPASLETPLGVLLILVAVALFALCIHEFRAAGTSIQTRRPTTAIITTGPYRFSRNPIYLSFTLLLMGIGIWVNSAWILAMLLPTLILTSYGVIAREERYLAQKFGEEYLQYKFSVRRWL